MPAPPTQMQTRAYELIEARLPLFKHRTALRLSDHELLPKLTIDCYNGHLLLTDYAKHDSDELKEAASACIRGLAAHRLPARSATLKIRPDNLSHLSENKRESLSVPEPLIGTAPPERFEVVENAMRFLVSFHVGFATGLFLDMAEGRQLVRDIAGSKRRVLNLFSYTGAFSVAAAAGGAESVIEVDTYGNWLGWSQNNQTINGVTVVRQRKEDAVKFMTRQKEDTFDLIICDPPSYANPKKGKRFTVKEGYEAMGEHFVRALGKEGVLLAACNHAQTTRREFKKWIPRPLKFERWIDPPPDFPRADYFKLGLFVKR